MKRDFENFLTDVGNGSGPALVLLFGDDLQVQSACKALIDVVVPPTRENLILSGLTAAQRHGIRLNCRF